MIISILEDRSAWITNTKTAQNLDELNAYKEMLPYVKEYAPKAFDAVFSNYAGKLVSYYALAERLKEKAASNTLYETIIKNRHQVAAQGAHSCKYADCILSHLFRTCIFRFSSEDQLEKNRKITSKKETNYRESLTKRLGGV